MANGATLAAPLARPLFSRRARERLTGYVYLLPVGVVLGGTALFPILKAMHMSLYNHVLIKPQEYRYVGLANYVRLLHDEVFWLSLWNSFVWVFGSVSFQFLGGFAAALLLHQSFRGRALVRTITLLAGLQAIPTELYEAARVDGAAVSQRFRYITLPMLRPIIVVATATRIVWTFNYADLIFVMTSGGPANATQITSTYTLMQAYSNLDFGYAGALSVVLLVVMLSFTALYLRVTK